MAGQLRRRSRTWWSSRRAQPCRSPARSARSQRRSLHRRRQRHRGRLRAARLHAANNPDQLPLRLPRLRRRPDRLPRDLRGGLGRRVLVPATRSATRAAARGVRGSNSCTLPTATRLPTPADSPSRGTGSPATTTATSAPASDVLERNLPPHAGLGPEPVQRPEPVHRPDTCNPVSGCRTRPARRAGRARVRRRRLLRRAPRLRLRRVPVGGAALPAHAGVQPAKSARHGVAKGRRPARWKARATTVTLPRQNECDLERPLHESTGARGHQLRQRRRRLQWDPDVRRRRHLRAGADHTPGQLQRQRSLHRRQLQSRVRELHQRATWRGAARRPRSAVTATRARRTPATPRTRATTRRSSATTTTPAGRHVRHGERLHGDPYRRLSAVHRRIDLPPDGDDLHRQGLRRWTLRAGRQPELLPADPRLRDIDSNPARATARAIPSPIAAAPRCRSPAPTRGAARL